MGWTTYARRNAPKDRAAERAEIIRIFTAYSAASFTATCLMASKVGRAWYLAIRLAPNPGETLPEGHHAGYVRNVEGAITFAAVALTSRSDSAWGYKGLSESMGPFEAAAPLKLLALLSPLDPAADRYAQAWRDKVRAVHEARRARLTVRAGDVIEVDEPIAFTGGLTARRFEAFEHRRSSRSRAQLLYRTLDTQQAHTVRLTATVLRERGARLAAPEEVAAS